MRAERSDAKLGLICDVGASITVINLFILLNEFI